jgi:hypothetical protein
MGSVSLSASDASEEAYTHPGWNAKTKNLPFNGTAQHL